MFISLSVGVIAEPNPFSVSGYGVINYSHFDWELDPDRRAAIDVERFVIAPKYRINDTIRLESELEFEHGGTGSTMEFDKFEEFGEFETEIEKGGEVIVEKLAAVFSFQPSFNLRVGHIIVPVGLVTKRHRPHTTLRQRAPKRRHISFQLSGMKPVSKFSAHSVRYSIKHKLSTDWIQRVLVPDTG